MEEVYQEIGMNKKELEEHLYNIRSDNLKKTLRLGIDNVLTVEKNFIDHSELKEFKILSWETYPTEVEKRKCEFILKKYNDQLTFEKEKTVLVEADKSVGFFPYAFTENKAIGIFPKPLSHNYNYFNEKNLILMDSILSFTLEKRMEDAERESIYWGEIKSALDPIVLLHDLLPYRRKDIKEGAEVISHRKYIRNSLRGIEILKEYLMLSNNDKMNLQEDLLEMDSYLSKEKNITTIQKEGYPWHNMFRSLVSANIGKGNRALHLGYLFGHPSVYNKLKNVGDAIKNLCEEYQWRREKLAEQEGSSFDKDIDTSTLERDFYIGAIIGNLNAALKMRKKYKEEFNEKKERDLKELARTLFKQISALNERGIKLGKGIRVLNTVI